ncbi:MAG: hypothetical protein H8E12_04095 [Rhodobacteraceae bacterium]|nr:hypothetical protein [Paracoccaceae bacterium]
MRYVIIETERLGYVDFTKTKEDSPSSLRYSLDGNKFLIKYEGEQPEFVFNITQDAIGLHEYNHQEVLEILKGSEWTSQG